MCFYFIYIVTLYFTVLCFFSLGLMFSRMYTVHGMYIETIASNGCIRLPGVQSPPLSCPPPGCLQQLPPVQGLQILLFALLTSLRHRLSRNYGTLFPEEKDEQGSSSMPRSNSLVVTTWGVILRKVRRLNLGTWGQTR